MITKALAFKSTLRFRCMFSSSMFQFLFFFFLKTERIGLWSFYKLVFSVSRNFFFFRKRIRVLLTRVKRNSSRLRRSLKLRFSRKREENRNFRGRSGEKFLKLISRRLVQILAKVNSFYGQLPYSSAHFCGLSSVLTYFRQKREEEEWRSHRAKEARSIIETRSSGFLQRHCYQWK